ncbi:hypothetical protein [Paenibacillus protaetiae]|uniref:Uncharacterized protein n=1 Tax=Paenibacillus protaetiae TaxID=2509456 RepID=A0A4P6EX68_9BACL|nr:hypothetical protein [Paenibacillus protaetiae]QAY68000.1 hypothetical protein ET464_18095 [Paenibacillus protaetiae]
MYESEQGLNYAIEIKTLLNYVIENLYSYWASWIIRLDHQLACIRSSDQWIDVQQLDETVEWCTLGMLRQLYTLKEHGIKSKVEAGYYGITIIPQLKKPP